MKLHIVGLALFAALQAGSAQELGEVSGRVIDSFTRQPLAGATVVLFRWGEGSSFLYDTVDKAEPAAQPQDPKSPMFTMLTGDDGRFSFKTTPSAFSLYAKCKGYVQWGNDMATNRFLSVEAGKNVRDIVIAMDMPGSISGRVFDPETEKPIPGLSVTPKAWHVSDGGRALLFAGEGATTDKRGMYEIKGLRPGEYVLAVSPALGEKFLPGGTEEEFRNSDQRAYVRSYYPGVERREEAQNITLPSGATLERIDFKLNKLKAAAIRGCIHSDLDRDQLGDVALDLIAIEVQGTARSFSVLAQGKAFRTGDCFRVDGLPPGTYWLNATAKGADPAGTKHGFAFLDLADQKVDNIELDVVSGLQVKGTLRLSDATSSPLPKDLRMEVDLRPLGRSAIGEEETTAEVTPSGGFVLRNVYPGSYKVGVRGLPKYFALGETRYNGAASGRDLFAMNAGALDQKLELVLHPATASLSVNVEGGAKSAGAQLVLLPEMHDGQDPQQDALARRTDADGNGTFANLLAGKYRLFAFSADAAWRTDPAFARQMVTGRDVEVANDSSQSLEVKLTQVR